MAHEPLAQVLRHLRRLVGAPPAEDVSDGDLLERFAALHDQGAFTTLMQRHGPLVYSVCRRLLSDANDVEDAFQATFVVLVRRAASLRREGSLGSWLYTVAYRIALKARARSARRHSREQQAEDMAQAASPESRLPDIDPTARVARRELAEVLDDEVSRLPEKYRAPLVLCYLEGKTNEQAARELGYPLGSMSWRLDKGRELLRRRLSGRGVALSVGVVAAALTTEAATAAVPTALGESTLQSAVLIAAGKAAADVLSPPVAALAEQALAATLATKVRFVALLLLPVLLGTGAGVLAYQSHREAAATTAANVQFADEVERRVEQWQPTRAERRIDDIAWAADIRTAKRLGKEHNRPVFLLTHTGRIGTGRCGGGAFNLRAFAFADPRVIALLNGFFVPVYSTNEDYQPGGAGAAEEGAERERIYHQTLSAKRAAGTDCVYILSPDGGPFDSVGLQTAKKADLLVERLQEVVKKLGTVAGPPVVKPTCQSVPPPAPADALVLHLTARTTRRDAWCEFPAENWIVLESEEWRQLLPAETPSVGRSWDVPSGLSARLLTCFYPQTENNDLGSNRLDQQSLRATVVALHDGVPRVRLDGKLLMKHRFYPNRDDDNFADATITGFFDFDLSQQRMTKLRLVTDRATYGGHDFTVAVRSLP